MEYKIEQQVRGTRIITGQEASHRRELLNMLIDKASVSNNFNEIILPSIEKTELYTDKAGDEIISQMYNFNDKKGRDICLRPEGTATIQALYDQKMNGRKDVKLWYFDKFWRYERPQEGRYREFFQFGVEHLNPSDWDQAERDLIDLAEDMVSASVDGDKDRYRIETGVKRGLDYYIEDGFEINMDELGTQSQVCGGGRYKQGIGFAIGFDRLFLAYRNEK